MAREKKLKPEVINGRKYFFEKEYNGEISVFDSKNNYIGSARTKKDIVETVKMFRESNIPADVIDEMQNIKDINQYSERPESLIEWKQAKKYGDYYWRMLKKYPALKKMGYDELDIQWYDE